MSETKNYPKSSAGNYITAAIPIFNKDSSIEDILREVLSQTKKYDTISYIYIIDSRKKLLGVYSLKYLLALPQSEINKPASTLINPDEVVITVHPYSNKEKAAQLAVKYNIKAVPVVDSEKELLGVIDSDHILSIMHEEKVEDLLKLAGISKGTNHFDNFLKMPLLVSLKHRIPWLILGLLGGLAISYVITTFETTLRETVVIAAFIPVIVYMSSAVGTQTTAFLIRDSVFDENISYFKYFAKQLCLVTIIAMALSILLFLASLVLHDSINLSFALGVAMFGTVMSSIITGFVIPYIFLKLKQDPANSSGPIGTVIQDFLSVLIYFAVVSALL